MLLSGTVDVLRLPLFFCGTSTSTATVAAAAVDSVGCEISTLVVGLSFVSSAVVLSFDLATPRRVLRGDAISSSGSSSSFTRTAHDLATTSIEFVRVPPVPRVVLRLLSFLVPRRRLFTFSTSSSFFTVRHTLQGHVPPVFPSSVSFPVPVSSFVV